MTHTTLPKTKTKKVLIIEDEGDMCLLLNILLNGKELELDHVKNLLAAEEYLQKEKPAVVLLDNKCVQKQEGVPLFLLHLLCAQKL